MREQTKAGKQLQLVSLPRYELPVSQRHFV